MATVMSDAMHSLPPDDQPASAADEGPGISRRQERLLLTVILLLAALLRLGWPGIVQFSLDEAQTTQLALEIVRGRGVPLFGTGTSFGLPTSPISEYVYVPAAALWDNPLWLTWFTAALNMAALALFWWFSRRYWGPLVALCASAVFAAHPWAIISSRKIWEPNLMAVFTIPWAITGEMAFHERRPKALVAHMALLSLIAQLHYSGLALIPVTGAMLLLARKHIDRRMLLAGLAVGTILALPFLYGLTRIPRGGWRAGLDFVSGVAKIDGQSLRLWWITATGSDLHSLAGWLRYQDYLRALPPLGVLHWTLGALVLGGIALWLVDAWRRRRDAAPSSGLITSLWALAPLLLLVRHVRPLYLHYFVVAIPALCLAAGLVLGRAVRTRWWLLRAGAVTLVIVLAGAQAVSATTILHFVGSQATPGGFGVPLQPQLRAIARARTLGSPLIVLADGDDPRHSDWAAVFGVLADRVPHRIVDGGRVAIFPAESATLLITPGAHAAIEAYSAAGALDLATVVPTRQGEEPFRVLRLEGATTPALRPAPEPCRLAHGAQIAGYRMEGELKPGHSLNWWVAWRVWREPARPHTRYHIFNHLVDSAGNRLAQADGPTIPPGAWRTGDLVIQHFRLNLPAQMPAGPFWMHVGMYTYPQLENQPVLDATDQPVGDFVTLGPLPSD